MYINDLIDPFGPECEPLELNRKPIYCLLYADDIILLSESAKGLQKSLDILQIKVITKLPNSEQSYKGKVKTHNYINRQNHSTTGKL